ISHPGSRTWPLGLVLFYTDAFDKAVDVLETDIHGFENKFEEAATDERIWQAAAMFRGARVAGGATAEGLSKIAAALPPLEIEEPIRLRKTVYEV
ncbi:unnamed protein product, partial [Sphacelaria rigidula]